MDIQTDAPQVFKVNLSAVVENSGRKCSQSLRTLLEVREVLVNKLLGINFLAIAATVCLSSTMAAADKLYAFTIGKHTIEGNQFEFKFPGSGNTDLYLFNLDKWNFTKPRAQKSQLIVKLYDGAKQILDTGQSVDIPPQVDFFGSVAFSLDQKETKAVRYFSLTIKTK